MEISSCTLIPLFRPRSVHNGSASWDTVLWSTVNPQVQSTGIQRPKCSQQCIACFFAFLLLWSHSIVKATINIFFFFHYSVFRVSLPFCVYSHVVCQAGVTFIHILALSSDTARACGISRPPDIGIKTSGIVILQCHQASCNHHTAAPSDILHCHAAVQSGILYCPTALQSGVLHCHTAVPSGILHCHTALPSGILHCHTALPSGILLSHTAVPSGILIVILQCHQASRIVIRHPALSYCSAIRHPALSHCSAWQWISSLTHSF